MSHHTSRREAIKTGIGILGAAINGSMLLNRFARADADGSVASAKYFVTDGSGHRHEVVNPLANESAAPAVSFSFNDRQVQQTVLGFGAALTEASCTVINRLAEAEQLALLDELYNPAKSNFGIGRLCIGASDYSTVLYSYDEGEPDPSLARFSIDHDKTDVLPVLNLARKVRPDLFLFSSPWSPPGWMKYANSMLGGSIRPQNLEVYAQYITKYLKAYSQAGVTIDAMTVQNEVDADQYGAMPACTWPEEVESNYIINHLAPSLSREKLKTQIWILDHNYNLSGRVYDQLAQADVRKVVQAVAWHGYAGDPMEMAAVHKKYPQLATHWTEGGDDFDSKTLQTAWTKWAAQFAGILNNGSQSITTWNLALDETGHPNIGPFHCAGIVTIDSKTKAITRNGIYWALLHYAKAFPRGSKILESQPSAKSEISAVAGLREDGSLAIVLSNSGSDEIVELNFESPAKGKLSRKITLSRDTVLTVLMG